MATAVCPGSFDPVTNGHLDVFERASLLFDHVTVAVLINKTKASLFTVDERMEMLSEQLAPFPNVSVDAFHGLLVDYCRDNGIAAIVKGSAGRVGLRLRVADGPDEPPAVGCRDAVRLDQPRVRVPVVESGEGGRHLWG